MRRKAESREIINAITDMAHLHGFVFMPLSSAVLVKMRRYQQMHQGDDDDDDDLEITQPYDNHHVIEMFRSGIKRMCQLAKWQQNRGSHAPFLGGDWLDQLLHEGDTVPHDMTGVIALTRPTAVGSSVDIAGAVFVSTYSRFTSDLGERLEDGKRFRFRDSLSFNDDADQGRVCEVNLICRSPDVRGPLGRLLLLYVIANEQARTRQGEPRYRHIIMNISMDHFKQTREAGAVPRWKDRNAVSASYGGMLEDFGFTFAKHDLVDEPGWIHAQNNEYFFRRRLPVTMDEVTAKGMITPPAGFNYFCPHKRSTGRRKCL